MNRELQGYTMENRNYRVFTYALIFFCFSATCNGITFVNFTVLQVHIDDIATPLSSGINMNIEANSMLDCTRQCSSDLGCASVIYSEANELKCREFSTSMTLMADVVVPFVGSGSVILASKMVSDMDLDARKPIFLG